MIEIKNLKAGYDEHQVLFGVDMKVKPNEIVVLIGPNGAGKSTIIKSVFNLTKVYRGKIIFKGKDITKLPTHDRIQMGIGYVPQGRQVFPSLTVRENLEMGAFLTTDKDLVEKRIKEITDNHFPELKKKMSQKSDSLSGGQQQMLAIGRALMMDPQLLMLDEPSLGLSPKLMKELFRKIMELRDEGTAILMVEQNAKQAVKIADRIYVLEDGKIAMSGGKSILKKPKIKHIYLGGH